MKKTKTTWLTGILLPVLLLSCTPGEIPGSTGALMTLDRENIAFAPDRTAGSLEDTLTLCCNRSWSSMVEYDENTSTDKEWIQLSQEEDSNLSGTPRSFKIIVSSSENENPVNRSAVLSFFYEGNVKKISISQPRYIQRISIDRSQTPDTVYPNADSLGIFFESNDDWTAELSEAFPEASLSSVSGRKGSNAIFLRTGRNVGEGGERSAKVILRNGGAEDSITVTQDCWYMSEAVFHNGTGLVSKDLWPFIYPGISDLKTSASKKIAAGERVECTMRDGSTSWFVQSAGGLWRTSTQGFNYTCSDAADGLEMPVEPSLRLVAVELTVGYVKKDMPTAIRNTSNEEVKGGEGYVFGSVGETHCWYLDPEAGAVRKIWASTVMIREVRAYYEY